MVMVRARARARARAWVRARVRAWVRVRVRARSRVRVRGYLPFTKYSTTAFAYRLAAAIRAAMLALPPGAG
jgi:hypothetical protein